MTPVGIPYRWRFEPTPRSIAVARRRVREILEARSIPAPTIEMVELLTSEVVTNAIVHGESAPEVELVVSDQQVRVAVEDDSPEEPKVTSVEPTALTGRGLDLVDRFSATWGTTRVGPGKQVWFEVPFAFR